MSRVAVVGCGAMGSVYAGLMAAAGHEVFGVTLWPDHAAAMARDGLRVEGASGDRVARVRASTTTRGSGPCDLVIIATKAFDVEAAARASLPLLGPETVVQTIQNGLGSAERVAPIVGEDRLAVGVVGGFGASMRGPGHVHHNGMEMVRFGAYAGLPRRSLRAAADIWESAGFQVALFDDVARMVWEKLIMNVAFSGTCCLTGLTIGEVMADPNAWTVARGCAEEAVAVAGASGVRLQVGDPVEHVRALGGKIPYARSSMLLDHMQRRRAEVGRHQRRHPPPRRRARCAHAGERDGGVSAQGAGSRFPAGLMQPRSGPVRQTPDRRCARRGRRRPAGARVPRVPAVEAVRAAGGGDVRRNVRGLPLGPRRGLRTVRRRLGMMRAHVGERVP